MKRYSLIFMLLIMLMIVGCSQSGKNGELMGVSSRGKWFEPVPYGMTFIRRGSIRIGPSDQDPTAAIALTKTISLDAFWMDDTEITNNEYRQFVNWVRDSIARQLYYDGGLKEYGNEDESGYLTSLNWKQKLDWKQDTSILSPLYLPAHERFFRKKEIDTRKLFYDFAWLDLQKAARRSNSYDYKSQSYNGGIQGRQDFIVRAQVHVYPDTLCWIRDFTYSYNEPLTSKYFWHPGFDDYPVVGVNWKQAEAFCHWRTKIQNDFFASMGEAIVQDYRLPTEFEWEYAARGGLQNAMYPWGGYYARNQVGEFMSNFKPARGNYIEDGGLATMKVGSYPPNDFGLYDMSGNVAEWTITAFDELSIAHVNELNPDFKYNAADDDPPALKRKVIRGGSWKDIALYVQVSTRTFEYQDSATSFVGFRCVRSTFGNDF
jgi:formylglycine-generating enzyme